MLSGSVDRGVQLAPARNCGCAWIAEWNEVRDCKVVSASESCMFGEREARSQLA
jgi:hypothetical protein